jgi:Protein of unknown function (DUF3105)
MATKKKKRRRSRSGGAARATQSADRTTQAPPGQGGANVARRERKEQARAAREAERKRAARSASFRRAAIISGIGLGVFAVLWWVQRAAGPKPIPQAAVQAAQTAGCTTVGSPLSSAPGNQHVDSGTPITYDQHPATSGQHYGDQVLPVTPDVYTEPLSSEPAAVHFLEHAGVILYYRAHGEGALPQDVIDSLATVAHDRPNTIVAPYQDLPDGTSLAMTAWNKLQTCPGSVTAAQAKTIADGFADAYVCSNNAPEPKVSDDC